jgi:hypothetical protein
MNLVTKCMLYSTCMNALLIGNEISQRCYLVLVSTWLCFDVVDIGKRRILQN